MVTEKPGLESFSLALTLGRGAKYPLLFLELVIKLFIISSIRNTCFFQGLLAQETKHKLFLWNNSPAQEFKKLYLRWCIFFPRDQIWYFKSQKFPFPLNFLLSDKSLWNKRQANWTNRRKERAFVHNSILSRRKTQAAGAHNPWRNLERNC